MTDRPTALTICARWVIAPALLGAALVTTPARGNGRFPAANQLVPRPGAASDVTLRATFGLLVSQDSAVTFDWICEDLLGPTGDADPPIAVFGDGSIVAAPVKGVSVTHDGGCSFDSLGLLPDDAGQVLDLAVARSQPDRAYAVSWSTSGGLSRSQVFVTDDDGRSWSKAGDLPGTDAVPTTIDVAPGDPLRLYAAGTFSLGSTLAAAIFGSQDGGATWTRTTADVMGASSLWISAVDPVDPGRVYVRTSGGGSDRLLRTDDGGLTFTLLATADGPMLGFALSPDGSHLAYGGDGGVFVTATDVIAPARVLDAPITCLAWGDGGLFACGATMPAAPFGVARSTDAGASFTTPLRTLGDVRGPLTGCPPGSAFLASCPAAWPAIRASLPSASGSGGGAGTAGSGGGAGSPTAGSGGVSSGSGGSAPASPSGGSSGGCSTGGSGVRVSVLLFLLASVLGLRRRP